MIPWYLLSKKHKIPNIPFPAEVMRAPKKGFFFILQPKLYQMTRNGKYSIKCMTTGSTSSNVNRDNMYVCRDRLDPYKHTFFLYQSHQNKSNNKSVRVNNCTHWSQDIKVEQIYFHISNLFVYIASEKWISYLENDLTLTYKLLSKF